MQIDKTTLTDLSIFHAEDELSIFHFLDHTHTSGGREHLRYIVGKPHSTIKSIKDTQATIQELMTLSDQWPATITNGTIMMMSRFYDAQVNSYPSHPNVLSAFVYRVLNGPDFSLTQYTLTHGIDFLKGLQQICHLLEQTKHSQQLKEWKERILTLLNRPVVSDILTLDKHNLSNATTLTYASYIRFQFKQQVHELIDMYSRLDAYLSLAIACKKHSLAFPEINESEHPYVEATELYHPLLHTPVSYNVALTREKNFLFLTGANMAGKSTFIKAVGLGVYLAHLGMGVPAKSMQLSLFHGLLSNINVVDNILKGESYFFNEVQRIHKTIQKISDGKHWLILIDELFKGTNVQDAMKCSTVVIEGLRKMQNVLFILSTHLYEIGEPLKNHSNIQFRYFETSVENDQLIFSYQLKEGISNDRLGYLILKREGVVNLLENL